MVSDKKFSALIPEGHTKPIGRYSPGVRVPIGEGRTLLFVSGQVSSDQAGQTIGKGDPQKQAEVVFVNLENVLKADGATLRDLVSVTIYLTDMAHFEAVSAVRNRMLGDPPPASTLVEVSRLAIAEHLVEINGIALVVDSEANL